MSLFLKCVSAVINITANVAAFLFTVSGSTWFSTWFLVTTQTMSTDPCGSRTMADGTVSSSWQVAMQATHIKMAPSNSMACSLQHSLRLQHRTWTSTQTSARRTMDPDIALGDNTGLDIATSSDH